MYVVGSVVDVRGLGVTDPQFSLVFGNPQHFGAHKYVKIMASRKPYWVFTDFEPNRTDGAYTASVVGHKSGTVDGIPVLVPTRLAVDSLTQALYRCPSSEVEGFFGLSLPQGDQDNQHLC